MSAEEKDLVSNRRATYDYEILETFEAGMVLLGTEIKSLRANGGSLQEAYVKIEGDAPYLIGSSIAPYRYGNIHNHEERRERKLLMHHREIERLRRAVQEKGLTVIALGIYLRKGKAKIKIALAKGKRTVDKRAAVKERDDKRQIQRAMRENK